MLRTVCWLNSITLLISAVSGGNENICLKPSFEVEPNLSIGSTSFKELVQTSNLIVDKSLLIKELLEDNSPVILITYPRKWGKTINLSMLKDFLYIPVNQLGNRIPQNKTANYRLFKFGEVVNETGTVEKFHPPLMISQHDHLFETHQGKHPVIYVDFSGMDTSIVMKEVKRRLSDSFRSHAYIMRRLHNLTLDPSLHEDEINAIKRSHHIYLNIANRNTEGKDMTKSLLFLSELLYEHFQQPVYILINDYDALIRDTLLDAKISRKTEPEILRFFEHLMTNTFVKNSFLKQGIITGIYMMNHFMPALNNTKQYNFVNNTLHPFFGFNRTEVNKLYKLFDISSDHTEQSIYWYKAYKIAPTYIDKRDIKKTTAYPSILRSEEKPVNVTRKKKEKVDNGIYNPWTMLNYVENRGDKRSNFWVETGSVEFLKAVAGAPLFKEFFMDLFNEEVMRFREKSLYFHREEFWHLTNVFFVPDHKHKISQHTIDLTLAYLWTNGYLTFSNHAQNRTTTRIDCKIPNEEVRQAFQEIVELGEFGRTF